MANSSVHLLICAGGTGGGVNPALAVLQALGVATLPDQGRPELSPARAWSVLWVGAEGGMEADLVQRAGVPFEAIPAAGVHGVGIRRLPGNLLKLARGYGRARQMVKRFQPDVMFFTGGYVAAPVALAGWRVPTLLYVPDIEPGLALKTLARFADRIAVTAPESRAYFSARAAVQVSGYPVRADLKQWDLEAARQALGLQVGLPTLLVVGGSSGARSINRAVLAVLPQLLAEMQVVHLTGRLDWDEVQSVKTALEQNPETASLIDRYHPFAYLHDEMGAALAAADLALARAGASTLGEFPVFGLPAVLAPYPHAWRYQKVNATYLVERGAALLVPDQDLPAQLLPVVGGLMRDGERLAHMRLAMQAAAPVDAAQSIGRMLQELAEQRSAKG